MVVWASFPGGFELPTVDGTCAGSGENKDVSRGPERVQKTQQMSV